MIADFKLFLVSTFFFTIFLIPIWLESLGANTAYQFFFYPLFIVFFRKEIQIPSPLIILGIFMYSSILIISIFINDHYVHFIDRRFISFVIFISMFFLTFVRFNQDHIIAFKFSLIVAALIDLIPSLIEAFQIGLGNLSGLSKFTIADGGTRYGFVYLMAFWVSFLFKADNNYFKILKYLILLLMILGILLTFNRSSFLALILSIFFYFLYYVFFGNESIKRKVYSLLFALLISSLFIVFVLSFAPYLFTFFEIFLLKPIIDGSILNFAPSSKITYVSQWSSEGYRIFIYSEIMDFVSNNLFLGSGFLGVWILFDELSGSAHGQYQDVIFRTGIIGSLYYFFIITLICKELFKSKHTELFWGFFAILIFSFFNESFALGTGKFILAFLLAICFQKDLIIRSTGREN
tara:strand:- start:44 stop:1261 length:1218 start_codon:yes stop_codon:yes gene_type:complete